MAMVMSRSSPSHLAVAIPFPGRGHINPMIKFCELLLSRGSPPRTRVLLIVTEEWLGLINSGQKKPDDDRISFLTIPNAIPSECIRGSDHPGFVRAVQKDMVGPVEQLLDALQGQPPDVVIVDTFLTWGVDIGAKRNIPVASFWPMAASTLSVCCHHDLITNSHVYPIDPSEGGGEERISFIPGVAPIRLKDIPMFQLNGARTIKQVIEAMSWLSKAQYLILRTMDELEGPAIEALKANLSQLHVYTIGPSIPVHMKTESDNAMPNGKTCSEPNYIQWLNGQPERSVLYVSMGSFLSISKAQLHELAVGLKNSRIPVLWVAKDKTSQLSATFSERGMVVPWCDQMRVLKHPSTGGFLSHCGWNSTLESVFAGVPTLTFPLLADQTMDEKLMVEDWKVGQRLKNKESGLVSKNEISEAVRSFMDLESEERIHLDANSKQLRDKLLTAVDGDGSTSAIQAFISRIFRQ